MADIAAVVINPIAVTLAVTAALMGFIAGAHGQEAVPLTPSQILAKGGVQLKGPEIVATTVGHTAYNIRLSAGRNMPKGTVVIIYYPDAKTRVFRTPTSRKVEALWWIDGDQLCAEYKVERQDHVCGTIYRLAGSQFFCEKGMPTCEWQTRSVHGNPEGL